MSVNNVINQNGKREVVEYREKQWRKEYSIICASHPPVRMSALWKTSIHALRPGAFIFSGFFKFIMNCNNDNLQ